MPMPAPLMYDDEIAALPAFRMLAYLDGAPDDPRIALAVGATFDAFVARFGGDLGLNPCVSWAEQGSRLRSRRRR